MKIKYSKEILEPIIKDSTNFKEVTLKLGLSYCNGSLKRLKGEIEKFNINISHFHLRVNRNILSDGELFVKDSKVDRTVIKNRIKNKGLIPYICECCGQDENWKGKIMPLILDHKDGINNNNELSNLRFLCSNCDSIQDTYKSKNKNVSQIRRVSRDKVIKDHLNIERIKQKEIDLQLKIFKIKESNIDFSKQGWLIELGILMNWSPQYSGKFVKNKIPEIWGVCKKHKSKIKE